MLKNTGISIDSSFTYDMDVDAHVLNVRSSNRLPEGFWGEKVHSLAAIVGKNGAGKSSCLEYILDGLIEGSANQYAHEAVVVYEDKGSLTYYAPEDFPLKVYYDNSPVQKVNALQKVNVFYYNSNLNPYLSLGMPTDNELAGTYNGSDSWRMIQDLEEYSNIYSSALTYPYQSYRHAFTAQDNCRIIRLLQDERLASSLKDFVVPEWILLSINDSSELFIRHRPDLFSNVEIPRLNFSLYNRQGVLGMLLYQNLLNLVVNNYADVKQIVAILKEWKDLMTPQCGVLDAFNQALVRLQYDSDGNIRKVEEIVSTVVNLFDYNTTSMAMCLSVHKKEKVQKLVELFSSKDFLVARYFDLVYSRSVDGFGRLSSGEWDALKLFSRIYDAICLKPDKFTNIRKSSVLLLDEAENSFHPYWQMCLVQALADFLGAMDVESDNFQVVLTSHSPVLLSDIPKCCVTFLNKEGNIAYNVSGTKAETFGSNVYELYKDAFFMEEGLVGKYAQKKIAQLEEMITGIDNVNNKEQLLQFVDIIGDKMIKSYLLKKIEESSPRNAIEYYERKLRELKNAHE